MSIRDQLNRPMVNLRISVTDRCNLRCQYCMPETDYTWLPHKHILTFEETSFLVDIFSSLGVERIRLTGGEPLLRTDLADFIRLLSVKTTIQDLALTTNGVLLADQASSLRAAGLQRITVSLDTLKNDRFHQLTRSNSLEAVQAGLNEAVRNKFDVVKIDTVVIRGVNDDEIFELLEYGKNLPAEVRFIEYMDVGGATRWTSTDVVPKTEILQRIESRYGQTTIAEKTSSAPADRYRLRDGTTFGIISSTTNPFCQSCDRCRLTADGLWYTCLYAKSGTDLRQPLRDGASKEELRSIIDKVWCNRNDRGAEIRMETKHRQPFISIEKLRKEPHLEMHTRGG